MRDTVTAMSTKLVERGARIRRTKWVELSCLLCGEAVGTLEGGSVLRPCSEVSVKVAGARMVCGRGGGGGGFSFFKAFFSPWGLPPGPRVFFSPAVPAPPGRPSWAAVEPQ